MRLFDFCSRKLNGLKNQYYFPTYVFFKVFVTGYLTVIDFLRRSIFKKNCQAVAIYNLKCAPVTFDFAYFLYQAEVFFAKKGWKNFSVVIVTHDESGTGVENASYAKVIDEKRREKRVAEMLLPMARMYGSVDRCHVVQGEKNPLPIIGARGALVFPKFATNKHLRTHSYKKIFSYNRAGYSYVGFSAPGNVRAHVKLKLERAGIVGDFVVLTVRSYGYQPLRNTSLEAYAQFAAWLKGNGVQVVIVPDADGADKVYESLQSYYHFPEALSDLEVRVALSELAVCSVFTSNGLHALCALNRRSSYILAGYVNENYPESTGLKRYEAEGLKWGDQPFTENNSVVVWEKETAENLKRAFSDVYSGILKNRLH
ncbi:hypothetical protein LPB41_02740 [Thalassospira sp. MA62]|nr:hypothetical protein [Thalassospira sp. MA62]